jgi:urease accessory protein UreF
MAKGAASTRVKRLTIRLLAEERRSVERAASAERVPASAWARQVVLRRIVETRIAMERREERRRSGRELVAMLRSLPDDSGHADEVERVRRKDFTR